MWRLATGGVLQAKLRVGLAGDRYEREADQVADEVMRDVGAGALAHEDDVRVRRSSVNGVVGREGGPLDSRTEAAVARNQGQGASLPESVRTSMETAFGADFGAVRVHTGAAADDLNRSMQSRAFTVGSNIFFARGEYQPGRLSGKHLLAHELTHTVQQGATGHGDSVRRAPDTARHGCSLSVTPGAPNAVQRAGHQDAWCFSKDRRYVIKVTSDTEAEIYDDEQALGIAGVIPGKIATLQSYADIEQYGPTRKLRQPNSSESIIVIENLARKTSDADASPVLLDAKIGFRTASWAQAEKEGVFLPWLNALRHEFIDNVMYNSRQAGYRFEEGQDFIDKAKAFSTSGNADDLAPHAMDAMDLWTALAVIVDDLQKIQKKMEKASVTFVGSSALMVIFPDRPLASSAKMIDFAHPMRQADEPKDAFQEYRQNYVNGIKNLMNDLFKIAEGLTNVASVKRSSGGNEMAKL